MVMARPRGDKRQTRDHPAGRQGGDQGDFQAYVHETAEEPEGKPDQNMSEQAL